MCAHLVLRIGSILAAVSRDPKSAYSYPCSPSSNLGVYYVIKSWIHIAYDNYDVLV